VVFARFTCPDCGRTVAATTRPGPSGVLALRAHKRPEGTWCPAGTPARTHAHPGERDHAHHLDNETTTQEEPTMTMTDATRARLRRTDETAADDLASALVTTWHACETTGANLPEALSYALGLAAKRLVAQAAADDPITFSGTDVDQELATAVLVAQRPGSWEATHVVELTYPIDLLAGDTEPGHP